eukprot:425391-Rhodomonas_salina.1
MPSTQAGTQLLGPRSNRSFWLLLDQEGATRVHCTILTFFSGLSSPHRHSHQHTQAASSSCNWLP